MTEGRFLTHPEAARMFVQERSGGPWYWVGAVDVKNLQLYPRQLEYTRLVGLDGVYIVTVPRTPNPTQFDVQFHLNWAKWQGLHQAIMKHGCLPNFLMVSAACRDSTKIADPNYNNNGVVLYGAQVSSGYTFGSGGSIQMDANTATSRKDQIGFVCSASAYVRDYLYGLQALISVSSTPLYPKSLAVIDAGECADYVCRNCDNPGALQYLINDGSNFSFTLDGGKTWATVGTSGAGVAQAYNGNAFAVSATGIKIYLGLDASAATLANWQSAVTDVTFAGLCKITKIDASHLVVGGTNGAVWMSSNGGGNWKQIRAAAVTTAGWYSFKSIKYNAATKQLIGVGIDSANNVYIQYSTDRGYSWNTIGTALAGKTWAGSSFATVYASGPVSYVVDDGDLYMIACANNTTTVTKLTIIGAAGDITGIGGTDPANPNEMFLTVWNGTNGFIVKTIDGFNSVSFEALPMSITTGKVDSNPIAMATSKYGVSLLIAFGQNLIWARDWESFFVDELDA